LKLGQRTSNRVKNPVNYNNMEKGTGAVSDGLDYDISGSRAAVQKRPN
jgi:hypothetical protein